MSYIDTGEDEVDYGEAEDQNAVVAFPLNVRSSASYAVEEEEKEEEKEEEEEEEEEAMAEEVYEDLYDDVDIIFDNSAEIGKDKEMLDLEYEEFDEKEEVLPYNEVKSSSSTVHYADQQRNAEKNFSEKQVSALTKLDESSSSQIGHGNEQIRNLPASEKQVSALVKLDDASSVQKSHGNEQIKFSLSSDKQVPSLVKVEDMLSGQKNNGNEQISGQRSHGNEQCRVSLASEKQPSAVVKLEDMSIEYGNEQLSGQRIHGNEQVRVSASSEKQVAPVKVEDISSVQRSHGHEQVRVSPFVQMGGMQTQTALVHDSKPNETIAVVSGMSINKHLQKEEKEDEEEEDEDEEEENLEMDSDYIHMNSHPKIKIENAAKGASLGAKAPLLPLQGREFKRNDSGFEEATAISKGNEVYNNRPPVVEQHGPRKMLDNNNDRLRGNENLEQEASQSGGNRVSIESTAVNDYVVKSTGQQSNGCTMLFVGELHWWTTDEELETALSEYGVVKNLKFFEERASGKFKGYCQVEFFDHSAAFSCKEGMNGKKFHGRPCLVAFANPRTIVQMGTAQVDKAQAQLRAQQAQIQSRRTMNNNNNNNDSTANTNTMTMTTRGGNTAPYQSSGDNPRGYGRQNANGGGGNSGRGNHGQNVATGRGSGRGRGNNSNNNNTGNKGMNANGNMGGVTAFGQSIVGPMGGGLMMPQALIGQGYDPSYGPPRGGGGYGGYVLPGPPFTGMVQPFPTMGPGALAGVSPHVNPAFFGRNATSNGMGMMGGNGMDGSSWGDGNMNGWGGDDHDRRGREASYGDDMGGSDYTYSNELAYERSRGAKDSDRADAEWPERHRQREREGYREPRGKDHRDDKDDDWEKEKMGKSRNKGRSMMDDDERQNQRGRSKEEEYGKRRRLATER